jgi:hypothetical protein
MSIREKMSELGKIGTQIREKLGNLEKTTFYSKKSNNFIQLMIFLWSLLAYFNNSVLIEHKQFWVLGLVNEQSN